MERHQTKRCGQSSFRWWTRCQQGWTRCQQVLLGELPDAVEAGEDNAVCSIGLVFGLPCQ